MKWYSYIICFVLVTVGVFCGVQVYKEMTATSYINGSIDITNKFSQESFSYSNSSVVFYDDLYDDADVYSFDIDLLAVKDFDGQKNKYKVSLNDYILTNTQISAGSVYSVMPIDFYGVEGNLVCNAKLNISVKFLSNKTSLSLSVVGDEENDGLKQSQFFEQYFSDEGIRLKILKIL